MMIRALFVAVPLAASVCAAQDVRILTLKQNTAPHAYGNAVLTEADRLVAVDLHVVKDGGMQVGVDVRCLDLRTGAMDDFVLGAASFRGTPEQMLQTKKALWPWVDSSGKRYLLDQSGDTVRLASAGRDGRLQSDRSFPAIRGTKSDTFYVDRSGVLHLASPGPASNSKDCVVHQVDSSEYYVFSPEGQLVATGIARQKDGTQGVMGSIGFMPDGLLLVPMAENLGAAVVGDLRIYRQGVRIASLGADVNRAVAAALPAGHTQVVTMPVACNGDRAAVHVMSLDTGGRRVYHYALVRIAP